MSHSFEGPNRTRITYNPDLSEVELRFDGEVEVDTDRVTLARKLADAVAGPDGTVTLCIEGQHTLQLKSGEDLLAFIAEYVRRERVAALDDMTPRQVLGLPERGGHVSDALVNSAFVNAGIAQAEQKGAAPYCDSCSGPLSVSDDGAVEPCTECMLAREALVVRCGHCNQELEQVPHTADAAMDVVEVYRCSDCDKGGASEQYAAPMVLFVGEVGQVRRRFREVGLDAEQVRVDRAGRVVMPATAWIEFYNRAAQQVLDSRLIMTADKVELQRPKPPSCGHPQTVRAPSGEGHDGKHRSGGRG